MLNTEIREISEGYLTKAYATLEKIPSYIELEDYIVAVNRAYYSAFYALKALEILDGYDSKKHSGVIAFFRKEYIKNDICDSKYSKIIGKLQDAREVGDYNIIVDFNIDIAREFYDMATEFVNELSRIISNRLSK